MGLKILLPPYIYKLVEVYEYFFVEKNKNSPSLIETEESLEKTQGETSK